MILHNGKEYYPLDFGKLYMGGKTYYDRASRQNNYFYLDFHADYMLPATFIPYGSDSLLTSDGNIFRVATRL